LGANDVGIARRTSSAAAVPLRVVVGVYGCLAFGKNLSIEFAILSALLRLRLNRSWASGSSLGMLRPWRRRLTLWCGEEIGPPLPHLTLVVIWGRGELPDNVDLGRVNPWSGKPRGPRQSLVGVRPSPRSAPRRGQTSPLFNHR
jgi:hypothetical protein